MELKFLFCCQQTHSDLDADSRGKQSPHHERVKARLWHGMLAATQMRHAGVGAQAWPLSLASSTLWSPSQEPGLFSLTMMTLANSIHGGTSIHSVSDQIGTLRVCAL